MRFFLHTEFRCWCLTFSSLLSSLIEIHTERGRSLHCSIFFTKRSDYSALGHIKDVQEFIARRIQTHAAAHNPPRSKFSKRANNIAYSHGIFTCYHLSSGDLQHLKCTAK